jgi:Protein of unknown function (DUF2752)
VFNLTPKLGTYRKRHLWHGMPLLAFFIFAATVSLDTAHHASHCLMQKFVGIPCPFCGLTRALGNLYHGNVTEAWKLNPVAFIFLPMGSILLAYRAICVSKPRLIRVPLTWELALYYGVFLLFVLVWIVRLELKAYA